MKPEVSKIKSTVFENFTKITNEDENVRLGGAAALIQQLEKSSEEKVNNEWHMYEIALINLFN